MDFLSGNFFGQFLTSEYVKIRPKKYNKMPKNKYSLAYLDVKQSHFWAKLDKFQSFEADLGIKC